MVASNSVELAPPFVPADMAVFITREPLRRPSFQDNMPSPDDEYETEQRGTPARQSEPQDQGG